MTNETNEILSDYSHFDAGHYLRQYYQQIDFENKHLLAFFADMAQKLSVKEARLLDYGCGPVIYPLVSLAPHCKEIHMADYLSVNLEQIRLWLENAPDAFDWRIFFAEALRREGITANPALLREREQAVRQKITHLFESDIRHDPFLHSSNLDKYDLVLSCFCLEAVAQSVDEWRIYFARLVSVLQPGGDLIFVSLVESNAYDVGDKKFSTLSLPSATLYDELLRLGFRQESIEIRLVNAENTDNSYQGFMLCSAHLE